MRNTPSEQITCSICNDVRFVHPLQESGKPDYSKAVRCECYPFVWGQDLANYLYIMDFTATEDDCSFRDSLRIGGPHILKGSGDLFDFPCSQTFREYEQFLKEVKCELQ